jgi:hypothetical protein
VLLVTMLTLLPLFACACMLLDGDGMAPPASGTALFSASANDDDDALDVVFGDDPGVVCNPLALPAPELNAVVRPLASQSVLPRIEDPADHPPRRA